LITIEGINKMIEIYSNFSEEFKKDLILFQKLDDKAK
jgi:hypothetical protein